LKSDFDTENDNKLKGLYFKEQISKCNKKLMEKNINLKKRINEK